jgi:chromosome segregation ATPase
VILSIVVLTFAVLLGASAVPVLWQKVHPSRSASKVAELDAAILDLQDRIEQTADYVTRLRDERTDLKGRVGELGYRDFDALADHPEALALLEELSEVDTMVVRTEKWLADARQRLDRTRAARRRMRRLEEGEAATGVPVTDEEVSRILDEVRAGGSPPGPATVEEYAAREHLRELFETEFGQ